MSKTKNKNAEVCNTDDNISNDLNSTLLFTNILTSTITSIHSIENNILELKQQVKKLCEIQKIDQKKMKIKVKKEIEKKEKI